MLKLKPLLPHHSLSFVDRRDKEGEGEIRRRRRRKWRISTQQLILYFGTRTFLHRKHLKARRVLFPGSHFPSTVHEPAALTGFSSSLSSAKASLSESSLPFLLLPRRDSALSLSTLSCSVLPLPTGNFSQPLTFTFGVRFLKQEESNW